MTNNENLIGTAEAAKRLGVSGAYVRKLVSQGKLDGRRVSGIWMINPAAIEQHTAQRDLDAQPAPADELTDDDTGWRDFERPLLLAELNDATIAALRQDVALRDQEIATLKTELNELRKMLLPVLERHTRALEDQADEDDDR